MSEWLAVVTLSVGAADKDNGARSSGLISKIFDRLRAKRIIKYVTKNH